MKYKIKLDIKGVYNVSYDESSISLGTSTKETLDRSYDLSSLEILLTNVQKEFQPFTPIHLAIYTVDSNSTITDSKQYNMIVEEDDVEDVYIGSSTKYNHKLILIESTKLLETELMPNISLTQPVKNIVAGETSWCNEPIHSNSDYIDYNYQKQKFPSRIGPGSKLPSVTCTYHINKYMAGIKSWPAWLLGLLGFFASASVVDATILLRPSKVYLANKATNTEYLLTGSSNKTTVLNAASENDYLWNSVYKYSYSGYFDNYFYVPEGIPAGSYDLKYEFSVNSIYIRNFTWWPIHTYFEDTNLMTLDNIKSYISLGNMTYSNLEVVASSDGIVDTTDYKMMSELLTNIEDQTSSRERILSGEKSIIGSSILSGKFYTYAGILANSSFSWYVEPIDMENRLNERDIDIKINLLIDAYNSYNDYYTFTIQTAFFNSSNEVVDYRYNYLTLGQLSTSTTSYTKTYTQTYKNVLNTVTKIGISILKVYPSEARNRVSFTSMGISTYGRHLPKYQFTDSIKAKAATIVSPEFTFEKKTLWEICLEVGEIFNGIPFLNDDDKIDYKILDNNTKKDITYLKESETKSSNMTNYATKLYTPELKNIIQDCNKPELSNYTYFPSPSGWASVRSGDNNTTIINRESASLVIEGENSSIYKLIKVLCKFGGTEYDITDYVLEKSLYDCLSSEIDTSITDASTSEKGSRAYYVKGKSNIENLAQLPNNGSIIGWKQTYLTIQFILFKKFGLNISSSSKDIFDYKFRIIYVPYHSRLNVSRQSNLNDIYNQVAMNFNQSSNTVSSTQFAKHAESTIEKLGGAEITSSYTSSSLNDNIETGDCLVLNDRNYYVNTKSTTFNNIDKSVTLSLTKDNYKQNFRISVPKEYRQYNIDSSNQIRKTILKPFTVVVSSNRIALKDGSYYITDYSSKNKETIRKSLFSTLDPVSYPSFRSITNAYIYPETLNEEAITYNSYLATTKSTKGKIVPVIGEVIGNTITMQWDALDNFSIGRKIKLPSYDTKNWWDNLEVTVGNLTLKEKDYGIKVQDDSRYCDDNGATPRIYTSFFSNCKAYPLPEDIANNLPDVSFDRNTISSKYAENELQLDVESLKDSREKLSVQVSVSAQTFDKDISIYNLMRYNPLVSTMNTSKPEWYGYTNENVPTKNEYFQFNPTRKISTYMTKSMALGDPLIYLYGINYSVYNYSGCVLCYPDGEVLLDIRKQLKFGEKFELYLTVYSDEINTKDIVYTDDSFSEAVPEKLISVKEYTPSIYMLDNKIYIDLDDFKTKTSLNNTDIVAKLVTKHNTFPRGILCGFRGRSYAKHSKGDLTLIGNNWEYNGTSFNTINVNSNGEIVFTVNGAEHNIYDYLMYKSISKQDMNCAAGSYLNTILYGISINYNVTISKTITNIKVTYDKITKKPSSIEIV